MSSAAHDTGAAAEGGRRFGRARMGRMAGGVFDQAVWALSNLSLVIVVAKRSGLDDIGAIGLVVLLYVLVLGLVRAATGLSLIIRFTAVGPAEHREGGGAAVVSAALLGLIGTVLLAAVGLIGGGRLTGPMVVVAVQFPLLMVQDVVRYIWLAERRPWRAARTDFVWVVVSVAGYGVALAAGGGTTAMTAAWALGGSVSGLLDLLVLRLPLLDRSHLGFARRHWDLTHNQAIEAFLQYGSSVFAVALLGLVASLKAVGQVNLGTSLLGPLRALLLGVAMAAVPDAVHTAKEGVAVLRRHILVVSLCLGAMAAACGVAIQVIPDGLGTLIVGKNWHAAQAIAVPLSVGFLGLAVSFGPLVGLRSQERARVIVRCSIIQVIGGTAGFMIGAVVGGAISAAYGQAVALVLATAVWWRAWIAATDHLRQPTPTMVADAELAVEDTIVVEGLGTVATE